MDEVAERRHAENDPITLYHADQFELRRLKGSSEDFQQLFEDIMVRARPGFMRIRPYGKQGDRKCDGLFRQDGIFFQVYSPDELKQSQVCKKINEDLDGAIQHWKNELKAWIFVYNARKGVPPDIPKILQEKQAQYPYINIEDLSNDALWKIARELDVQQRSEILGTPPTETRTLLTSAIRQSNHSATYCHFIFREEDINCNYTRLCNLLIAKEWEAADKETRRLMCEAVGRQTEGWLRLEDIDNFPIQDLCTIDRLWIKYSDSHFGFSIQKQIWQSCGYPRDYGAIWEKIGNVVGWRTSYLSTQERIWLPNSKLIFDESAPKGHLPRHYLLDKEHVPGGFWYNVTVIVFCSLVSKLENCK
jgi:hypothetical protein